MQEEIIEVQGRRVRYKVTGDGQPIVLIHGLSGSTRWWRPVISSLAARYRLYLVDLPGFGTRRHRVPLLPLREVPAWLIAWMDAVRLPWAHIIGHSMGGAISVLLAANHPDRVRKLVLVDAAGIPVVPSLPYYAVPFARALRHLAPSFWPVLVYDAARAGPVSLRRAASDLQRVDIRPYLSQIRTPTLIIWGQEDTLVPLRVGKILDQEIPDTRLIVFRRAGHVPMYDRPRDFAATVLDFLSEH